MMVPESLNTVLSALFGLRLVTKTDFDFLYQSLMENVVKLETQNTFVYLPRDPFIKERVEEILKLLHPRKALSQQKIRFGSRYDGGYVCLNSLSNIKAAVSLGINDDVSWDLDIAARGIKVFQYDHSIEGTPVKNDNFEFSRIKVTGNDGPGALGLDSIMRRHDILEPATVFLKMDIEGCEWEALSAASESTLEACSQIICEFHNLQRIPDGDFFEIIVGCLRKLKQRFEVIHLHGNNHTPLLICPGVCTLPQTLEVTFANKSVFSFEDNVDTYPTELDAPCYPKKSDYFVDLID